MSYDIHITRKAHWAEEHGPQITRDEWRAYVQKTPETLRWTDTSTWTPGDECVDLIDNNGRVFGSVWWHTGSITTRRPEPTVLIRTMEIARDLRAVVMGDDGETYRDFDAPSFSTPAYRNPNNASNTWEEPPAAFLAEAERARLERVKRNRSLADAKDWTLGKALTVALIAIAAASFLGNMLFDAIKPFLE
jgi:hypothetical protein